MSPGSSLTELGILYAPVFLLIPVSVFFPTREGQLTKLPETKKTLLFTFNGKRTGMGGGGEGCVWGSVVLYQCKSCAQVLSPVEDGIW